MNFAHFTAGSDDAGRRLDRVLRRFLSEEHLSSIYKSLRKGLVKVDGKKREGNFRVNEGDDIQIAHFLLERTDEQKSKNPRQAEATTRSRDEPSVILSEVEKSYLPHNLIIFKNDTILILNKPYDIPVQPSSSSHGNSLSELVQAEYEENHEKTSLSFKTGPLHRLDRKTTGVIAFSQNLEGARWFSEAIKTHAIQKVYLALLEGNLSEKQVWEDYIEKLAGSREQLAVSSAQLEVSRAKTGKFHTVEINSTNGKVAHTEAEAISHGFFEGKAVTLARILIKTGRTHQIRAQAAFHGFPLLGDTAYGGTKIEPHFGQDFFLHAAELHFPRENPLGLPKTLTAPLSLPFRKILENSDIPPYNETHANESRIAQGIVRA